MARWTTRSSTPALTTVAAGTALACHDLKDVVASVRGITTGTVIVEVSQNGTNYFAVGAALTADGFTSVAVPRAAYIRIRATVATSISAFLDIGGVKVPLATQTFGT